MALAAALARAIVVDMLSEAYYLVAHRLEYVCEFDYKHRIQRIAGVYGGLCCEEFVVGFG